MKQFLRWLGIVGFIAIVLALLIMPSPLMRQLIFQVVSQQTLLSWHNGAEYLSYISELLLIMLFGGVIVLESFAARVSAAISDIQKHNDAAWQAARANAANDVGRLVTLSTTLASEGRLSYRQCLEWLSKTSKLNLLTYNPVTVVRMLVRLLSLVPRGLYGGLALLLLATKTISDIVLMVPAG